MHTLILSLDGVELARYELLKRRYTIGRKPDNDIHIDNRAISGQHAVLNNAHDILVIEDLKSTNGTYVNGERVRKSVLKPGDAITIGHHLLRYASDTGTLAKTIDAYGSGLAQARLRILEGHAEGTELILDQALTTLGRADVQVAAIIRRTAGFFLVHVDSDRDDYFPCVNGHDIGPEVTRLHDRDVIEMASVKIGFYCP